MFVMLGGHFDYTSPFLRLLPACHEDAWSTFSAADRASIALLQIIFMGRRKFYMYNKQHGRNMIISEYIWQRWLATQPNPELIRKVLDESLSDKDPNKFHPMYRKRKQVSSHIQVQKGFFRHHWGCKS